MNKIDTLIAYLFAIQAFAKDIHYSASGEAFYSKHLLADEVYKGIDEQIDALIETCILPNGIIPNSFVDYWEKATGIIQDESYGKFDSLKNIVTKTLLHIETIRADVYKGEISLIDSIAQDLQRKLGLITRQVG